MTRRRPPIGSMLIALALIGGCATLNKVFHPSPIDAGADAVVVNAERSVRSAFVLADNFIALDDANRDALAAQAPPIHAFAEQLRQTAPATFRAAWASIDAYKAAPSTANGTQMENELAAVETITKQVRDYLTRLESSGAKLAKPKSSTAGLPATLGKPSPK